MGLYADGILESLENTNAAPGRFTVTGLLSEVDTPGEWWYNSATHLLYVYPLPTQTSLATVVARKLDQAPGLDDSDSSMVDKKPDVGLKYVRLGYWDGPGLISILNSSWVTLRDISVSGSIGTAVSISGGHNNTVGGSTFKNCAGGVSIAGGHQNRVVIPQVWAHLCVYCL